MIPAVFPTPAVAAGPNVIPPAATTAEAKFSDLVQQMVGDSAPAPPAQPPLIKGSAPQIVAPLPELPTAVLPTPAKTDEPIPTLAPLAPRRPDTRKAIAPDTSAAQAPPIAIDQPVPQIPLLPRPQLLPASGNAAEELKPAVLSADAPPRIALEPKPMLEVRLHFDPATAPAATPPVTPQTAAPPPAELSAPARPDTPIAVQPASSQNSEGSPSQQNPKNQQRGASEPVPPAPRVTDSPRTPDAAEHAAPSATATHPEVTAAPSPAQVPAAAPVVQSIPAAPINIPKPHLPAPSAPLQANPLPDLPKTQQPLRSMALEFTPDGANDIKVRLSEHGGDVHISLHGTDPTLAGRVREGVSDLVGSLSKAGYDAEAWTPSQGRQQERQQEPRQPAQQPGNNSDTGEFSSLFQQPTQENS